MRKSKIFIFVWNKPNPLPPILQPSCITTSFPIIEFFIVTLDPIKQFLPICTLCSIIVLLPIDVFLPILTCFPIKIFLPNVTEVN